MKKLSFAFIVLLAFFMPVKAQQEDTDVEPVESLTLKKGNIPPAIMKTVEEIFKETQQVAWGVFPYQLKDYGWIVDKDYNEPIDHYEIYVKAHDGTDIYALFESTGELIRYKSVNKNAAVPEIILNAIQKTPYKDWKIEKGTELITDVQKKIVEHFTVRLTNGTKKKVLYFTKTGQELVNKR